MKDGYMPAKKQLSVTTVGRSYSLGGPTVLLVALVHCYILAQTQTRLCLYAGMYLFPLLAISLQVYTDRSWLHTLSCRHLFSLVDMCTWTHRCLEQSLLLGLCSLLYIRVQVCLTVKLELI